MYVTPSSLSLTGGSGPRSASSAPRRRGQHRGGGGRRRRRRRIGRARPAQGAPPPAAAAAPTNMTPSGKGGESKDAGSAGLDGPPMQLAPNALATGGWSALPDDGAPARYRHACAVVGARLFVYGGRANSGRLAPDLYQLNLLSGKWSTPSVAGEPPDLRWGHSMSAFRQWCVLFGGHRRRGCLNDTHLLDTEAMEWVVPRVEGALPPPRGNHSAAVVADRLWLFGGDAVNAGALPHTVCRCRSATPPEPSHHVGGGERDRHPRRRAATTRRWRSGRGSCSSAARTRTATCRSTRSRSSTPKPSRGRASPPRASSPPRAPATSRAPCSAAAAAAAAAAARRGSSSSSAATVVGP